MRVTATAFRKDLFKLLERVLQGEEVEVTYKGATVHVAANRAHSKLARAKRQHALLSDPESIVHTDSRLMRSLESEWSKEWGKM